ncbi:MAG: sulfatase [Acidobacteriota bacterium]
MSVSRVIAGDERRARPRGRLATALAGAVLLAGCASEPPPPPNVLWVLWDTVRADRMSLYGYPVETTPFLDRWAEDATVFDDSLSPGTITLASHGSMFTGLLPSEHGADNQRTRLADRHQTLAEILAESGYSTFLWSANPHISEQGGFHQGFDARLHPWSPGYLERSTQIVRDKLSPSDTSNELPRRYAKNNVRKWDVKASGSLAGEALLAWLAERSPAADSSDLPATPYFAFLNYMEAHRPRIPSEVFRRRVMPAEDVPRSYEVDRSWPTIWSYSFGLVDFTAEELRVISGTYDATIAELDQLLGELLTRLEDAGHLDNTIVVLTSDHGEHLGEQHLLDHQYSVYEPLVRVPLVVHLPEHLRDRLAPGREARPVMTFDLFPTLLQLAGLSNPLADRSHAVSLLEPKPSRPRLSEYTAPFKTAFRTVRELHPDWQSAPWESALRALTHERHKLIRREADGASRLFAIDSDPAETTDLGADQPELRQRLEDLLDRHLGAITPFQAGAEAEALPPMSEDQRRRLEALGYLDASDAPTAAPSEDSP